MKYVIGFIPLVFAWWIDFVCMFFRADPYEFPLSDSILEWIEQ